mmetsp:Transcript_18799/g.34086  ORF Transcript_18799/g.34086 Transcript_18799/m.34086 type:complete len:528 (+) Transcript_18799:62-1645(+)
MNFPPEDLPELFNYSKIGMGLAKIAELFEVSSECVVEALAGEVGVGAGKLKRILALKADRKTLSQISELTSVPVDSLEKVFKDINYPEEDIGQPRKRPKHDDVPNASSLHSVKHESTADSTTDRSSNSNLSTPSNDKRGPESVKMPGRKIRKCKLEFAKGFGVRKYGNGDLYEGNWYDSKKNGQGKMVYSNGRVYEGGWVDNKKQGFGRYTLKNGDYFEGWWADDKKCGFGKYYDVKEGFICGTWMDEFIDSYGREIFSNGDSFEGCFKNGVPDQRGSFKWANGRTYIGEFHDGKSCGRGVQTWPTMKSFNAEKDEPDYLESDARIQNLFNFKESPAQDDSNEVETKGLRYEGEWKDDLFEGRGTFTWESGRSYAGFFSKDHREGYGRMIWPNADSYEGYWSRDLFHGFGVFEKVGELIYVGQFRDGFYHGEGKLLSSNGDCYIGEWNKSLRHGKGTLKYSDGRTYIGEWKYNMKHGDGLEIETNGTEHKGAWVDDKKEGVFKVWSQTGCLEETWYKGRLVDRKIID